MQLVKAKEMQLIDQHTIEHVGIPGLVLMENAGRSAVHYFLEFFSHITNKRVGVLCGRGNNGGDGFVIARYLYTMNIDVIVYICSFETQTKGDAKTNLDIIKKLSIPIVELPNELTFQKSKMSMKHRNIWIDALLGTGLTSDVRAYYSQLIEFVNALKHPIFSVDIPSGLNSDTGQPCGSCIQADATITFGLPKCGQFQYPGLNFTGKLCIADIGIPNQSIDAVNPKQFLLTPQLIREYFIHRPSDAHKGKTGHLYVVAGSPGKTGAASMTALSAMRSGAGLVTLGIAKQLNPILENITLEVMTHLLPASDECFLELPALAEILDALKGKKCLALGPGLGMNKSIGKLLIELLQEVTIPMVIDADGLNHIADHVHLLKNVKIPIILTPHPGEMARLTEMSVEDIQKDRLSIAKSFAEKYHVHIVLKGAASIIAHPDGTVYINSTGNSGMASGGMGDVLTGIIAGFITQGFPIEKAIQSGVYIHGFAADQCAKEIGPFGYLASDVMTYLPRAIKSILSED